MQREKRNSGPAFDLSALGHPVWWAALALMLINDHLLKGGGVVPGWLTGKLSDFAFLVIAPPLVAAMLPLALPGRRPLALASVVALYVVTDLSPSASDAFVAFMARLGVRLRLWPDVTDLLALAILPVTVHLLRLTPPREHESRGRFTLQRLGVILGAAACVATSMEEGQYGHRPFLFNATPTKQIVRITWVLSQLPCDPPAQVAATLEPSDLDRPVTIDMASGQVAALDGRPSPGTSPLGLCAASALPVSSSPDKCIGAILEAEGTVPVLMVARAFWEEYDDAAFVSCTPGPTESRCLPQLPPNSAPGPEAVSLRQIEGQLRFVVAGGGNDPAVPDRFSLPTPNVRIAPVALP
jgi:hypothetical protein